MIKIIEEILDNEVPIMVGILAKLYQLAEEGKQKTGTIHSAQAELEVMLRLHEELEVGRNALFEEARRLSISDLTYLEPIALRKYVDKIRCQWLLFEKLLHEKWPTDGHIVAAQIKELLNELA